MPCQGLFHGQRICSNILLILETGLLDTTLSLNMSVFCIDLIALLSVLVVHVGDACPCIPLIFDIVFLVLRFGL